MKTSCNSTATYKTIITNPEMYDILLKHLPHLAKGDSASWWPVLRIEEVNHEEWISAKRKQPKLSGPDFQITYEAWNNPVTSVTEVKGGD